MYILFVLLFGLFNTGYTENDGILRIPLERMETGLEKLLKQEPDLKLISEIYNYIQLKYHQPWVNESGLFAPTNDTLPLFKYFDTQYYGIVNIGKPGKPFKMIMDTAWSYCLVPSVDCPRTSLACARHERYNHRQSSTYKPNGAPFNISGYIGYMSNDVFLVGQMNSTDQVFAELSHMPWINALYTADGIMGLGFPELSPGYNPFFYQFYQQNHLKEPIFSFFINRDPTTSKGGSLFFGGIDTKHNKTAFTSIAVNSRYYWQFAMDSVLVVLSKSEGRNFCKNGCNALADTSSNTIVGPTEEIMAINQLLGAEKVFFSNRYLIPCAQEYKGPKVVFSINNKNFTIKGQDYIQKLSYSGFTICLSAFQPAGPKFPPKTWTLGGAFLYQYYTAYDVVNRRIMIAEQA